MRVQRNALLLAAGLAALSLAAPSGALAQKYYEGGAKTYQPTLQRKATTVRRVTLPARAATHYAPTSRPSRVTTQVQDAPKAPRTVTQVQHTPTSPRQVSQVERMPRATRGGNSDGGRYQGGGDRGHRGGHGGGFGTGVGIGLAIGSVIQALPRDEQPPGGGRFIDDGSVDEPVDHRHTRRHKRPPPRRTVQNRGPSGAPPAGETRLIPDEVLIEVPNSVSARQVTALQRRFRLQRIESQRFTLSGITMFRWRIPDRRSVATVVRALEQDRVVASAQPNYVYSLQQDAANAVEGDPAQYELIKLHLPQAHGLAKGDNVRVAVIDSAIDLQSPELAGSIVGTFDTLKSPLKPHAHGTSIAGLIAAHGKLMGAAPDAKILAIRAFDPAGKSGAQGSTFNILKGLDWAAQNRARIVNMSFAGPPDPALHRALQVAHKRGIALIAAAGNAGPKSPPLYPAADPEVIAVTATDADDQLFAQSNRGRQIALAAPGKDILVALPGGGVEVSSGTSYSAAEVSGVAALLIQRDGTLTPGKLRSLLEQTAKDLGPTGRDDLFGAGLVNAYDALTLGTAPVTAQVPLPISRVSTGAR